MKNAPQRKKVLFQEQVDWLAYDASHAPLFAPETLVGDVVKVMQGAGSLARQYRATREAADDLQQQTLLAVWTRRESFVSKHATNRSALVRAWSRTAAEWECRHSLRKKPPVSESDLPRDAHGMLEVRVDAGARSPLQKAITAEEFRQVCRAARLLTPVLRKAFVRLVRECYGMPESIEKKVKSTLRGDRARMLAALRRHLGIEDEAEAA